MFTNANGTVLYEAYYSGRVKKAFFNKDESRLFVTYMELYPGVLLFARNDEGWELTGELEGGQHGLLNIHLRHVS